MKLRYYLGCIFTVSATVSSVAFGITDPAIKYPWLDLYYEDPALVWQTPDWFVPHTLSSAPEDFSYWQNVLPYPQYRNEDLYLVIPQLGLISPIVDIPEWSNDEALMTNGQNIDINKYLVDWIIEYVKSVDPWYEGKRIDFGHSNFFANWAWNFKTIFANLMRLDAWDQVWYYQRNSSWAYDLYKYQVNRSYPTDPSNVEALRWDGSWADALIFWCYHGLDGRRMIEATYLWDPKWVRVQEDEYALVPSSLKQRIDRAILKMQYVWVDQRKVMIIGLRNKLRQLQSRLTDDQDIQIIEYTISKLLRIYPS